MNNTLSFSVHTDFVSLLVISITMFVFVRAVKEIYRTIKEKDWSKASIANLALNSIFVSFVAIETYANTIIN